MRISPVEPSENHLKNKSLDVADYIVKRSRLFGVPKQPVRSQVINFKGSWWIRLQACAPYLRGSSFLGIQKSYPNADGTSF